ncbi:hypothetical protein C2S52_000399 [Perilla frutescens var. hirtella]|nr:hypothetical protein C2S52_000399 [Perilla frutescens var. hirtella]
MMKFIDGRKVKVTVVSAVGLPDYRITDRMKVYCKVSLNDQAESIKKSKSDKRGGVNPRWNFTVDYTLTENAVQLPGANLVVKLYCKRSLTRDKPVGEVRISIKNLFDMGIRSHDNKCLTYCVQGTQYGQLSIQYSFGEKTAVLHQPPDKARTRPGRHGLISFMRSGFLLLRVSAFFLTGGHSAALLLAS